MYFPFTRRRRGCSHWPGFQLRPLARCPRGDHWLAERSAEGVAANRLMFFHGNAGYALMRTQYPFNFERLDGGKSWEVYLFEYPGFGARPGRSRAGAVHRGGDGGAEDPAGARLATHLSASGNRWAAAWLVKLAARVPTRSPGFFSSRLTPASLMSRRESFGFCLSAGC